SKIQGHAAHQGHDDLTTQDVVGRQVVTLFRRQAPLVEVLVVGIKRAHRLAVRIADLANGGNPQSDQVAFRAGGIPLEVAVQAAVQTCLVQFVVGLGEVIQANIDIASLEQSTGGHKENLQTVFGRGQIAGDNEPLRLEPAGQVCVVI